MHKTVKPRVLVTGVAGFLGSTLCMKLVEECEYVYCIDNLQTGFLSNIQDLFLEPNFSFIEQDIEYPLEISVDQIYNLACPASPPKYQLDPIKTLKTKVLGSLNLLELADRSGATFLQASTS